MNDYRNRSAGDHYGFTDDFFSTASSMGKKVHALPLQRIIEKYDHYIHQRDFEAAERHLLYWLEEAKLGNDSGVQLLIYNELIGYYRKLLQKDKALLYADKAVNLIGQNESISDVNKGTTYVNAATAFSAFDEHTSAIQLFQKARDVYESASDIKEDLLGSLYNNMAITCRELKKYTEALQLFDQAIEMMKCVAGSQLEQAITYLNIADTVAEFLGIEEGEERIYQLLDLAYDLIQDESVPHDSHYAFVCEKCAPCFSYYGYFAAAKELEDNIKDIYEGT